MLRFRCFFANAQCNDPDLHILHHGDCSAEEISTPSPTDPPPTQPGETRPPTIPTAAPVPSVSGNDATLDFFCTHLSHQDCPEEDTSDVCGSDGRTYPS